MRRGVETPARESEWRSLDGHPFLPPSRRVARLARRQTPQPVCSPETRPGTGKSRATHARLAPGIGRSKQTCLDCRFVDGSAASPPLRRGGDSPRGSGCCPAGFGCGSQVRAADAVVTTWCCAFASTSAETVYADAMTQPRTRVIGNPHSRILFMDLASLAAASEQPACQSPKADYQRERRFPGPR